MRCTFLDALRTNLGEISTGVAGDRYGKTRKEIMTKVVIRTDDLDGFFSRAKDAARRADQGQAFDGKVTLSNIRIGCSRFCQRPDVARAQLCIVCNPPAVHLPVLPAIGIDVQAVDHPDALDQAMRIAAVLAADQFDAV